MAVESERLFGIAQGVRITVLSLRGRLDSDLFLVRGMSSRERIMTDPEAVVTLKTQAEKKSSGLEIGTVRKEILSGLEAQAFSPNENISTMALIKMFDLGSLKGREIASARVVDSASRLIDRDRPPASDEIELTNLARLLNEGVEWLGKDDPLRQGAGVVNGVRIAEDVRVESHARLRNETISETTSGDVYREGVDNWWNRMQLVWNVAHMTARGDKGPEIGSNFFGVSSIHFRRIRNGKDFSSKYRGIVPGMAASRRAEDVFFNKEHALAKIAATFSVASLGEFMRLAISEQMVENWERKLESLVKETEFMSDPKKLLMLADFQVSLDKIRQAQTKIAVYSSVGMLN